MKCDRCKISHNDILEKLSINGKIYWLCHDCVRDVYIFW